MVGGAADVGHARVVQQAQDALDDADGGAHRLALRRRRRRPAEVGTEELVGRVEEVDLHRPNRSTAPVAPCSAVGGPCHSAGRGGRVGPCPEAHVSARIDLVTPSTPTTNGADAERAIPGSRTVTGPSRTPTPCRPRRSPERWQVDPARGLSADEAARRLASVGPTSSSRRVTSRSSHMFFEAATQPFVAAPGRRRRAGGHRRGGARRAARAGRARSPSSAPTSSPSTAVNGRWRHSARRALRPPVRAATGEVEDLLAMALVPGRRRPAARRRRRPGRPPDLALGGAARSTAAC